MPLTNKELKREYISNFTKELSRYNFYRKGNLWVKHGKDFYQCIHFEISWNARIAIDVGISIEGKGVKKFNECELISTANTIILIYGNSSFTNDFFNICNSNEGIKIHVKKIVCLLNEIGLFKRLDDLSNKQSLLEYLLKYDKNHDILTRHFTSQELIELVTRT